MSFQYILKRVYRFLASYTTKEQVETPQTVSIEEYNKTKKELEENLAKRDTLTRENDRIIKENDIILAEIEVLESDIRVERIKNTLSTVPFRSDEARSKVLEGLVNSTLSIKDIQDTYASLKKTIPTVGTKFPQKSLADKTEDYSFIR